MSEFRDQLPAHCPPSDAVIIAGPVAVFRVVVGPAPTGADFVSQRDRQPNAQFRAVSECQCRGLSVYTDLADACRLRTLPKFKTHQICQLALQAGAGAIQQTNKPSHHTWWPLAGFDILAHCEVVAP